MLINSSMHKSMKTFRITLVNSKHTQKIHNGVLYFCSVGDNKDDDYDDNDNFIIILISDYRPTKLLIQLVNTDL